MLDPEDRNNPFVVIDFIKYTVSTGAYSVSFGTCKFLYPDGAWVGVESSDALGNSEDFLVGEMVEILLRRRLKNYFVWHVSSNNLPTK